MEKNSSQYSSIEDPQSKVGKITIWGVCVAKSVWTGLSGRRTQDSPKVLGIAVLEVPGIWEQLLSAPAPASSRRSCFYLLTCFPFFLLLFFFVFYKLQSARLDSRRAGGECVSSDKCHFLTAGFPSAGLGVYVWVLSHHFPRGLESGKNVLSHLKEWALICHEDK